MRCRCQGTSLTSNRLNLEPLPSEQVEGQPFQGGR
jgi:hypothetical protein